MRKLPDIQELLRRHLYGTTSERLAIQAAMNERLKSQAAQQRAEEAKQCRDQAAAQGLQYIEAGRRDLAKQEYAKAKAAEADRKRWIHVAEKHRRTAEALHRAS